MDNKFGVWKPYPDYEPEPGVCYIVAWLPEGEHYHSHFYEIAEYTGEGWDQTDFPFARKGAEVIAWMELPEMYKEEECESV